MKKKCPVFRAFLSLAVLFMAAFWAQALPVFGPWTPIFKGIDHAVGTNDPSISGNFPRLQVVHCVRVDLTDPDIQLFTTPRASSYVAESRETLTQTVPAILQQYKLQVASDANFYNANPGGADPNSAGVNCEVYGLQISSGIVVSAETSADYSGDPRAASLLFTTNKQPRFVFKNLPPGTSTTGIYTAITGYYPIVSNGVNIGAASISAYPDNSGIHGVNPRTAFGVSQDGRYLYLLTIDGRQSGYSNGALDSETAYWMLQCGTWNAINMDGGGSTSLYMADSTGSPVALNHSSYMAGYGRERYIGSHFGVYAKPPPAFINDVSANPDDTSANITWTTIDPATSQVEYGLTTDLGSWTMLQSGLVTNHAVLLSGLTPGTGYYFKVFSTVGSAQYVSSNFFFVTTNYLLTNAVFDLTNTWTYTSADLDGANWTTPTYDDSAWDGSGPGALWVDNRGPNFMDDIPIALLTEMPLDPNTGYPFHTYYLRTHFTYTNDLAGAAFLVETYLDDGAVLYLNGSEIYRLFMAPYPTPIYNSTLATGYACSGGNASCPIDFAVPAAVLTNLVQGDNLLTVEVHNFSAQSPDITFALSLAITRPYVLSSQLSIVFSNGTPVLCWTSSGFTLQQASNPAGPWTDVPGPVVSSPFIPSLDSSQCYFRLRK